MSFRKGLPARRPIVPRIRRPLGVAIAAGCLLVVAAGGFAVASIPDSGTGVFHGCYSKTTGALRVIDPAKGQNCATKERAVSWDQRGINWRGGWSSTARSLRSDAVSYQGSSYVAVAASKNVTPSHRATWAILASKGSPGTPGPKGDPGPATLPKVFVGQHAAQQFFPHSDNFVELIVQTGPLPAGKYIANAASAVDSSAQTALCWLDPVSTGGRTDDGFVLHLGTQSTETTTTLNLWDQFQSIAANDSIGLYCANDLGSTIGSTTYTTTSITVMPASRIDVNK